MGCYCGCASIKRCLQVGDVQADEHTFKLTYDGFDVCCVGVHTEVGGCVQIDTIILKLAYSPEGESAQISETDWFLIGPYDLKTDQMDKTKHCHMLISEYVLF